MYILVVRLTTGPSNMNRLYFPCQSVAESAISVTTLVQMSPKSHRTIIFQNAHYPLLTLAKFWKSGELKNLDMCNPRILMTINAFKPHFIDQSAFQKMDDKIFYKNLYIDQTLFCDCFLHASWGLIMSVHFTSKTVQTSIILIHQELLPLYKPPWD